MILDICIAIPLIWGMFKGFKRGLIIELCTLMALLLGVYGAAKLGDLGSEYLVDAFNTDPRVSKVLAFAILFLAIVILVFLFGKVLTGLIKIVALGTVNKLFGLAFGGFKIFVILSGLLYLLNGFPVTQTLIPESQKRESFLYGPTSDFIGKAYPVLEEGVGNINLDRIEESLKEGINL
jgi:membrane protein required for colicin V production